MTRRCNNKGIENCRCCCRRIFSPAAQTNDPYFPLLDWNPTTTDFWVPAGEVARHFQHLEGGELATHLLVDVRNQIKRDKRHDQREWSWFANVLKQLDLIFLMAWRQSREDRTDVKVESASSTASDCEIAKDSWRRTVDDVGHVLPRFDRSRIIAAENVASSLCKHSVAFFFFFGFLFAPVLGEQLLLITLAANLLSIIF